MEQNKLGLKPKNSPSVTIDQLESGHCSEWDQYVSANRQCSVYHLTSWLKIIKKLFDHDYYCLCARDTSSSQIVGILPIIRMKSLLFGDYMVSVPYFNYGGAVACDSYIELQLMQKASNLAENLGVSHIEFRDVVQRDSSWAVRQDKVNMLLDLPETPDELLKAIGAKRRSQIKRPMREGVEIAHGGEELLDSFYEVFRRNMRDLGTPVYAKGFFLEILRTFPEWVHIVVISHGGKPVASAFLLGFREKIEVPWASSLREVNKIGVNMLLYWEVLKYAIEQKYKIFDFGRSSVDSGTFRFKKQWGAMPQQLYWHYWLREGENIPQLSPNNPKYKLAIKVWQKLPLIITDTLGPMLVKNLP